MSQSSYDAGRTQALEPEYDPDHIGLLMELQELLDIPIDVATERMLRAEFRERALAEAVPYER